MATKCVTSNGRITPPLRRALCGLATALMLLASLNFAVAQSWVAAQIPNAKQTFVDSNGVPLAGGRVYNYVPNTLVPKSTWIDPFESVLNASPVTLDSAGRAVIFGQGNYRQQLYDVNGNLIWDGLTSAYGSSSPSGATGTDTAPVGTVMAFAGNVVPTNWMLAYGEAVSRTTYADLLAALTISTTAAVCTNTSTTLGGFTSTAQIPVGASIEASCLPSGTTVASITNATTVVVSQAATANGTVTATVFPWGNGDASTTFNLPDLRGRTFAGADCMGGSTQTANCASRLTGTYYGSNAYTPGVAGGAEDQTISTTLSQANLPNVAFTITATAAAQAITISGGVNGGVNSLLQGVGGSGAQLATTPIVATAAPSAVTGTAASGGSATAFSNTFATIQPTLTVNYIIKVAPNTSGAGGVVSLGGLTGDIVCGTPIVCETIAGVNTITVAGGVAGVFGPSSSTVGDLALWNNTTGSLLSDCGSGCTLPSGLTYPNLDISSSLTINGAAGPTNSAIWETSALAGSSSSSTVLALTQGYVQPQNYLQCSDTVTAVKISGNPVAVNCLTLFKHLSTSGWTGSRQLLGLNQLIDTASPTLVPGNDYILPLISSVTVGVNVGGNSGTSVGNFYGGGIQVTALSGATYLTTLGGFEADVAALSGSSLTNKIGLTISAFSSDAVHGSSIDAGIYMTMTGGALSAGGGFNVGFQLGGGGNEFPITPTTGSVMVATPLQAVTIVNGIDFSNSNLTFSGCAFKTAGNCIGGTGIETITIPLGANSTGDGAILTNLTSASSGNQQYSPSLRLTGQGWKTASIAASEQVDWIILNEPQQGSSAPGSNLVFQSQINGAGYNVEAYLSQSGVFDVTGGFQVSGGAASGNVLRGNGTNFVSATLAASDLSNGVTGSGDVVLATSPSLTTPTLGVATMSAGSMVGGGSGQQTLFINGGNTNSSDGACLFLENASAVYGHFGNKSACTGGAFSTDIDVASTHTLNLEAIVLQINGTAGVSCSGTPTSSFASTDGIVTHC